ncbi:unnamed protein product [Peniophora sp. CBMAI 1063]|nr:unnamed protein product [Peniophora sp. CBMAI 1063]
MPVNSGSNVDLNISETSLHVLSDSVNDPPLPFDLEESSDDTQTGGTIKLAAQLAKQRDWDVDPEYQLFYAGDALREQYELSNEATDIEGALVAYRRAHQLTPDDHPEKAIQLSQLAYSFISFYIRSDSVELLQEIVSIFRSAAKIMPDEYPRRSATLSNLARTLRMRYDRLHNVEDLDDAIGVYHQSIELADEDDPELPGKLGNMGGCLYHRFLHLDELDDLERALDAQRRAILLTPDNDHELPLRLSNLGVSLWTRFYRLEELEDLERALEADKQSIQLTSKQDPDLAWRLNNLAISLYGHFNLLGDISDLQAALEAIERSVGLTPPGHPELPLQLCTWAGCYHRRFEELGELEDITRALDLLHQAVDLTPGDDRRLPRLLINVGETLRTRFGRLRDLNDLESAVSYGRRAIDLIQNGDPYKPLWLRDLAISHRTRFEHNGSEESFKAAVECFMDATNQPLGAPYYRFECAEACIRMLRDHSALPDPKSSLLLAFERILDVLPELVWLGQSVQRRFTESARVGELVNAAACAAIEAGDTTRAVEWLEEGRGLVWSQVTSMRTPFDEVTERLPDLALAFQAAHQELQLSQSDIDARVGVSPKDMVSHVQRDLNIQMGLSTADKHRQAAIRYENLLKKIREHDGFENFMRPMKLADLQSLPAFPRFNGTLVYINVDEVRCHALTLTRMGGVKLVSLPQLSQTRAHKLRTLWTKHVGLSRAQRRGMVSPAKMIYGTGNLYGLILGRLWMWVVNPILQALGYTEPPPENTRMPHIVWCPTGPLTQVPLHAAGIYDGSASGQHVYDFVVSSYTTSLSTLLRCYEEKDSIEPCPSTLLVSMSDTPRKGLSPLPHVRAETARLRTFLPGHAQTVLENEEATVEAVSNILSEHAWVHLACHGSQNLKNPTASAFELYDSGLTLSALMGKASTNAELAFLSACETAVGDPSIPEESAHLAAGMLVIGFRGVVATMWSIWDQDGPVIVEAYYKRLLELRGSGSLGTGETGAAYALHDAVKTLREKVGEDNFERWVPFVHFGA